MPAPSFSFSPQFATIRSESPLAGMRPVVSVPEVRHTALAFREETPFKIRSAGEELVGMGAIEGISQGAGKALEGITAAYVGEREKTYKENQAVVEHERAKEIANIKAQRTPEEIEYEKLRNKNIQSLIKERGGDKKPRNVYPSGVFGQPKELIVEPESMPGDESFDINKLPDEDIIPIGSLGNIPLPQVVTSVPKNAFATTIPEDIFVQPKRKTYAGFLTNPQTDSNQILPQAIGATPIENLPVQENLVPPEMQVLLASSSGGIPDVGGKDVLSAQTQASAMTPATPATPATPQTPQQMSDFVKKMEEDRLRRINEIPIIPEETVTPAVMPETASIRPEDLFSNAYESWQDAEQANKMLAKMLPDYDVKPVKQETADGQTYYVIEPPTPKQALTAGVPEGLKIKSGKMDETGKITYDLEPELPKEKQLEALKQPIQSNDIMLKTIRQIKSIYKGLSPATGFSGSIMQYVQGSDAADVRKLVKTLQGNIAFKALSDMRRASPTGGALGAVSERELDLLASTLGSIDPNMSEFLFTDNLNTIEKILTDFNSAANQEIQKIENPQKFQSIQNAPKYKEGDTATNPQTGQKVIFKNGKWIPAK